MNAESITKPIRIIDLSRCLDCKTCERQCERRHCYQRNVRDGIRIGHFIIPYACKQCDDPLCVASCKKGAVVRDPVKGALVLDRDKCIGCGLCAKKCPFGSITMVESGRFRETKAKDGTVKKIPLKYANRCDLCKDFKKEGCRTNCPSGALMMYMPFNEVYLALPPVYRDKLCELFLNGTWVSRGSNTPAYHGHP